MMSPINEKYVVFKRDDWLQVQKMMLHLMELKPNEQSDALDRIQGMIIGDAEVIRHRDITAASIFYHYASTIESFAEFGSSLGIMDKQRVKELRSISDHFAQAADAARHHPNKRLPD